MAAKKKAAKVAKKTAAKKSAPRVRSRKAPVAAQAQVTAAAADVAPAVVAAPAPVQAPLTGICAEMSTATGLTVNKGETEHQYTARLCDAVSKLNDDVFNKLSEVARKFFDDCVDPLNKAEFDKLPALAGFVPVVDATPVAAPAPAAATGRRALAPAPAVAPAAPAATAKGKRKPAAPSEPKVPRGPNTESVAYKMRLAVINGGTDISFEQTCKDAGVKGAVRGDNAWNAYFNTLQAIRIAASVKAYKQPAK